MGSKKFQTHGPKELFSLGVTSVTLLQNKELLIGTGDGTVAVLKGKDNAFKRTGSVKILAIFQSMVVFIAGRRRRWMEP
jgi:hypothetical protein